MTILIASRFNGPPGSANGGYTCGLMAAELGGDVAVSLRSPPPLERELELRRDGERARLLDGETVVATAEAAPPFEGEPAPAVAPRRAGEIACQGYARWTSSHPFPTCFVCGPDREPGAGLRVFPGEQADGVYAAAWTPSGKGEVAEPLVWAALDCPTSAPVANFGEGPPIVLARLAVRVEGPVPTGEPHAIVSWPIATDGRKRRAGAALYDAASELLARSEALWIELRQR